jgi:4-hydroxy-2-oxoheptanedioate aldolase
LFDTEHAPNELPTLLSQLQACRGGRVFPVLRPAWNDAVLIKRILDIGARALLIPFVQDAADAARAVAACRYPPKGVRGVAAGSRASRYGRTPGYLRAADDDLCILVQVETLAAVDNLEAIAGTEGVNGIFIGPSDLAASMGHIGEPSHPDVQRVIEDAGLRLQRLGKAAGLLAGNEDDARRYLSWGFSFVAVGSDTGVLVRETDRLARALADRR